MNPEFYYAYIVASRSLTLYVGMTNDIERRVFQHKCKVYEGFSSQYHCDRLVWFERFSSPQAAIAREKQIKGWRREKKIALIRKQNPTWIDLSEKWYTPEARVWLRSSREAAREDNAGPSTPRRDETAPLRSG